MGYKGNPCIIINPTAGRGYAARIRHRLMSAINERFSGDYSLSITSEHGDAAIAARDAVESGTSCIIVVGGDGTVNEVVNGIMDSKRPLKHDFALGLVNCGTGGGLAQTLHLPASPEKQLDIICHQSSIAIDLGQIQFRDCKGTEHRKYFVSECQMGIGSVVVAGVGSVHKYFGGTLAFGSVALMTALSLKAPEMTMQIDNNAGVTEKLIGVVIGNGVYCGGGMKLTPFAEPNDGILDVLRIHDMPVLTRVWNFPKIYTGRHINSPHFSISQGRRIVIDSKESVLIEADGELLGSVPCEIEVIPSALHVKCDMQGKVDVR